MVLSDKITDILSCLQRAASGLCVSEIALAVGLPSSTTHRLLHALESRSLIAQDPVTLRYSLGLRWVAMAYAIFRTNKLLLATAQGPIERLRDHSMETVCFHVPFGLERVCVQQAESPHAVRYTLEIGRPLPLYAGAGGKLLLSHANDRIVDQMIEVTGLAALTPNTITNPGALKKELSAIRTRGYCFSFEEVTPLAFSVGCPVRDAKGNVVASLTVFGPKMRFPKERMADLVPELLVTADNVTKRLFKK